MYNSDTWSSDLPPTFTNVLDLPPVEDAFAGVARAADAELVEVLREDTDFLAFVEDEDLVLS